MFYKEILINKTGLTYKCSVVEHTIIRLAANSKLIKYQTVNHKSGSTVRDEIIAVQYR